ncbi:MAG TPA: SIMPL domain-containing protein [Kofleriaceae bacterium]
MKKLLPLFALAACHERVIAIAPNSPDSNPGLMTVTGSATLEVSPDCADLTMTLSVENAKPSLATNQVDKKETELVTALTKLGVTQQDMKLSQLELGPVYEPYNVLRGYRAAITVTVTTRDFAKIPTLMESGADVGATQMSSNFRRSDMPELKKKVRDMALAAARDKAKQTAGALGIDLGRIVSVGENTGGTMWNTPYFPQNAVTVQNTSGASLGGTMQNLSLDVTIGYQLTKS